MSRQGTKEGTMLKFVIDNMSPENKVVVEATRLLPLVEAAGFTTTKGSVAQAVSVARRLKGLSQPAPSRKTHARVRKAKVQQNHRVEVLGSFVDDALKGLQLLKGEIKRLRDIEKKYNAIKAQFS